MGSFSFERLAQLPHLIVLACESFDECGVIGVCRSASAFEFVF